MNHRSRCIFATRQNLPTRRWLPALAIAVNGAVANPLSSHSDIVSETKTTAAPKDEHTPIAASKSSLVEGHINDTRKGTTSESRTSEKLLCAKNSAKGSIENALVAECGLPAGVSIEATPAALERRLGNGWLHALEPGHPRVYGCQTYGKRIDASSKCADCHLAALFRVSEDLTSWMPLDADRPRLRAKDSRIPPLVVKVCSGGMLPAMRTVVEDPLTSGYHHFIFKAGDMDGRVISYGYTRDGCEDLELKKADVCIVIIRPRLEDGKLRLVYPRFPKPGKKELTKLWKWDMRKYKVALFAAVADRDHVKITGCFKDRDALFMNETHYESRLRALHEDWATHKITTGGIPYRKPIYTPAPLAIDADSKQQTK